jgi:hypothetical protein
VKEQSFYTFKPIANEELVKELALSFLLATWFGSSSCRWFAMAKLGPKFIKSCE